MMTYEGMTNPIKVSINQFYGIEINDFACATAQTAMWIAEAKTMKETELLINQDFEFFPLTNNANIIEGNALRMDWSDVVDKSELSYILGNPPFIGYFMQTTSQKKEITSLFVDFIHNNTRWCLWLVDCTPDELKSMPYVLERVEAVKQFRLSSKKLATQKLAETPTRFAEIKNTSDRFVVVPEVSSERRRYIPMGYMTDDTILSNGLRYIPNASLYTFGIITSNVHMAWTRTVCGRLKSDYDYSVIIVYNNFPWPTPTDAQKAKIEAAAQGILDARELYPNASLADLYDELTMPIELRKAHQANDRAVMEAYGFNIKMTEQECVAELMIMYQEMSS